MDEVTRSLSLEETEGTSFLIVVFNILMRGSTGAGTDLFSLMTSVRTRGNDLELCQQRLRFDIRKEFIPQEVFGQ